MATLYSNRTITSISPSVVSTVTYTQSRNGNKQYYNVTVEMNTTSSVEYENKKNSTIIK